MEEEILLLEGFDDETEELDCIKEEELEGTIEEFDEGFIEEVLGGVIDGALKSGLLLVLGVGGVVEVIGSGAEKEKTGP